MYATHRLMVIHPCAKYGKPMSIGRTRICTDIRTKDGRIDRQTDRQTDGRTDRQTKRQTDRVIPIPPPELCSRGYNRQNFI